MIIRRLRERDGLLIPTVREAAARAAADGITDLLVQPTHILNGIENDRMKEDVLAFEDQFTRLSFGAPLLSSTQDQFHVIRALMEELPPLSDRDALVFMGHGSAHHANTLYAALDYAFKQAGYPRVYMGTVKPTRTRRPSWPSWRAPGCAGCPDPLHAGGRRPRQQRSGRRGRGLLGQPVRGPGVRDGLHPEGAGEYSGICDLYVRHAREAGLV